MKQSVGLADCLLLGERPIYIEDFVRMREGLLDVPQIQGPASNGFDKPGLKAPLVLQQGMLALNAIDRGPASRAHPECPLPRTVGQGFRRSVNAGGTNHLQHPPDSVIPGVAALMERGSWDRLPIIPRGKETLEHPRITPGAGSGVNAG